MEAGKAKERVEIASKRKWLLSLMTALFTGLSVAICAFRVFNINNPVFDDVRLVPIFCLAVALCSWDHSQTIKAYEVFIRSKGKEGKESD